MTLRGVSYKIGRLPKSVEMQVGRGEQVETRPNDECLWETVRGDSQDVENEAEENGEVDRGRACGDGEGRQPKRAALFGRVQGRLNRTFGLSGSVLLSCIEWRG